MIGKKLKSTNLLSTPETIKRKLKNTFIGAYTLFTLSPLGAIGTSFAQDENNNPVDQTEEVKPTQNDNDGLYELEALRVRDSVRVAKGLELIKKVMSNDSLAKIESLKLENYNDSLAGVIEKLRVDSLARVEELRILDSTKVAEGLKLVEELRLKNYNDSLARDAFVTDSLLARLPLTSLQAMKIHEDYLKELKDQNKTTKIMSSGLKKISKGIGNRTTLLDDNQKKINEGFDDLEGEVLTMGRIYEPTLDRIRSFEDSLVYLGKIQEGLIKREMKFSSQSGQDTLDLSKYREFGSKINSIMKFEIDLDTLNIKNVERNMDQLEEEISEVKELTKEIKKINKDYLKAVKKDPVFYGGAKSDFWSSLGDINFLYGERLNLLKGLTKEYVGGVHEAALKEDIRTIESLVGTINDIQETPEEAVPEDIRSSRENRWYDRLSNLFENTEYNGLGIVPHMTTDIDGNIRYGFGVRVNLGNMMVTLGGDYGLKQWDNDPSIFLSREDDFGIASRITRDTDENYDLRTVSVVLGKQFGNLEVGIGASLGIENATINNLIREETLRNGDVVSSQNDYFFRDIEVKNYPGLVLTVGYNLSENFGVVLGANLISNLDGEVPTSIRNTSGRYMAGLKIGQ